jgi:hypothetical protein
VAVEVGVEPTNHFNSNSTALKAARSTGSDALPPRSLSNNGKGNENIYQLTALSLN